MSRGILSTLPSELRRQIISYSESIKGSDGYIATLEDLISDIHTIDPQFDLYDHLLQVRRDKEKKYTIRDNPFYSVLLILTQYRYKIHKQMVGKKNDILIIRIKYDNYNKRGNDLIYELNNVLPKEIVSQWIQEEIYITPLKEYFRGCPYWFIIPEEIRVKTNTLVHNLFIYLIEADQILYPKNVQYLKEYQL